MKVPPFRGLRTRLMLLMLLAALPAFVAIGYLAHDQQRHFADLYRKNNQTLANILASEHEQNFEQARLLLATLAYHPDIAAADGCQALVTTVAAKAPGHIANLFNVAPDGRIRCSAAGPTGHFNVADMAWFRGALAATGARVGEYHISRRSGQPTIVVTHTLRREGRVTAVLAAALDLSWLTSQISLARLPHGAAYGIFDNRGNHLLRHPTPPGQPAHNIAHTPLWRIVEKLDGPATFTAADPQGTPRLFAYAPLGPAGQPFAHLLVGVPADLAAAGSRHILGFALLTLSVAILLGLILGWLGGWFLVLRPTRAILDKVNRVAAGDYRARPREAGEAGVSEIGLLTSAIDRMAESLQAREQELQASRDRLQGVLENMPGTSFRRELAYPWRMEHISRSVQDLTGIPAARFLAGEVRYGELIHPDDLAQVEHAVAEGVAGRRDHTCEYRIAHTGGSWRWAHERGRAIPDADGQARWLDGVILDISEHKRLEEEKERLQTQLQQAQKMEALGQLTGGIAHDFNNILASVLGFAKLALRRHAPEPDGELAEYLREIITAGERARDLVAKMLAFGRAQPGRMVQSLAPLPLAKEATKMLSAGITASIRLETRFPATLPEVAMDAVAFHQVLVNLVLNARDAVGEKGHIIVALSPARIEPRVCSACHALFAGDYVELEVDDDGCGMAREVLARIFEPFFTTKEVGKGTGLGLSMVHGLVARAGGHFFVESAPDRGTRFHVYLPLSTAPETDSSACDTPTAPPSTTGGTILLVDDEEAILRMLAATLAAAGWRTGAYDRPAAALAAFRDTPRRFDAVISDLAMPGMSGLELIAALRELRANLPAILCSGNDDGLETRAAALGGTLRLFRKPADPDALLTALAELVPRDRTG